jgi:3-deoxy-D-manno-octulosonic-acid transferase
MFRDIAYNVLTRGAAPVARVLAPLNDKLGRAVRGRVEALTLVRQWSATQRDRTRPLLWFHAPSVGEALMAQAIVQAVRAMMPEAQIAFTHFSPSAERMRERVGADVSSYMPWDSAPDMRLVLDALQPGAIAFVRTEIWPTLVKLSASRGVRSALVNAVLSAGSSRLTPLGRFALQPSYRRLYAAGAVNQEAAERLQIIGVPPERIRVTGDARFDQVWRRVALLDRQQPLLQRLRDSTAITIVAGSTWPGDEERLLPAFAQVAAHSHVRLLLAPHEPTEEHLHETEHLIRQCRLACARLSHIEGTNAPLRTVILIDRVGVLADLYAIADIAYVGGGFHKAGLHSVVEPAAVGIPVLFGPTYGNASEALELAAHGGGVIVRTESELAAALMQMTGERDQRQSAGTAARAYVESKLGGAEANAALLLDVMRAGK